MFTSKDVEYRSIYVINCITDRELRVSSGELLFSEKDFEVHKGECQLKREMNKDYSKLFFDALVPYKQDVFKYVQSYYRCFMGRKEISHYLQFKI